MKLHREDKIFLVSLYKGNQPPMGRTPELDMSPSLKVLCKKGLVRYDNKEGFVLTPKGQTLAEQYIWRTSPEARRREWKRSMK